MVALPRDAEIGAGDFASLRVCACRRCGHLYNETFREYLADRMYGDTFLTNMPVHVSMVGSLKTIAEWIGLERYANKTVIEIGAGSGHLARIIGKDARKITVYEPCQGLRPEMLPEDNVELYNKAFTLNDLDEPVDLIVCRQVIEHVASPGDLISQIAGALKPKGYAYLEVPRAEYIVEHSAFHDLHMAHVQYFSEAHFNFLAGKNSMEVIATNVLKDGHDVGVLFRRPDLLAQNDKPKIALPQSEIPADFGDRLARAHNKAIRSLETVSGPIGLYGATWHSQSLAAVLAKRIKFETAFDDNPAFAEAALYGGGYKIPIKLPSAVTLRELDAVVIGAYLHDKVIAAKLRQMGFLGQVFSSRPGVHQFLPM